MRCGLASEMIFVKLRLGYVVEVDAEPSNFEVFENIYVLRDILGVSILRAGFDVPDKVFST